MIEPSYFDTFVHIKRKSGKKHAYFAELRACADVYVILIHGKYYTGVILI